MKLIDRTGNYYYVYAGECADGEWSAYIQRDSIFDPRWELAIFVGGEAQALPRYFYPDRDAAILGLRKWEVANR